MTIKKQLGQFYTKNYSYILQNFQVPDVPIIEPFAGQGDLINYVNKLYPSKLVECYDIDPQQPYIIKRDTLLNPPDYAGKFIITNPPYLSRNKSSDKTYYEYFDVNDLYKCLIKILLSNQVLGGILIVPLNFWSSIRCSDISLRSNFLKIYDIIHLNIFEEDVFTDTSYTICSFQFSKKINQLSLIIPITIYPFQKKIETILDQTNNYIIGGQIYHLPLKNKYKITRVVKNNEKPHTNLLVKCIDDNKQYMISVLYVNDDKIYIDQTKNLTARTYMTLVIEPFISKERQKRLANEFNQFLNNYRHQFHSLFLSNYRESKDIARKRISFNLVYNIIEYLLENH